MKEAGPATMTSRAKVKTNFEDGKPKGWKCRGSEKGVKSDLGGTYHNDKPGLNEEGEGAGGKQAPVRDLWQRL